ncbi:hypothetical protein CONLIGDRAFT_414226 [Coniochaeta ligniaria NRRL 30616]|uniref:Uncharacterized protein n=1 Tax=Coniochaeta ligniaria NRRL 30616 TaxID=1408157 RepID=A0A1J7INW5_9PEZI|nr:hypothetical protein CONLIGDRAFT_414226 [Coniochaeta ligniaria NRRL 30616]
MKCFNAAHRNMLLETSDIEGQRRESQADDKRLKSPGSFPVAFDALCFCVFIITPDTIVLTIVGSRNLSLYDETVSRWGIGGRAKSNVVTLLESLTQPGH